MPQSQSSLVRRKSVFFVVACMVAMIILYLIFSFSWGDESRRLYSLEGFTMGTTYSIKISSMDTIDLESLRGEVDELLEELNNEMSTYRNGSEISLFNQSESVDPFMVSSGFATVVRRSLELAEETGGAFDPTLDPLINLWGFGHREGTSELPKQEEIEGVLAKVGVRFLSIGSTGEIRKKHPDLQINLNAIAKGYGVDAVSLFLESKGFRDTFVEIGGEVLARGTPEKGRKWRVGVEIPDSTLLRGEALESVIELDGQGLATSGNYRNFVVDANGVVLSHILDPRTGYPVTHALASVSVLAPDCMTADALATALFVMGVEEGLDWVEARDGVEALFIERTGAGEFRKVASSGFEENRL